jgi:hypothetical protein
LDRREMKWQEVGGNCIMRSYSSPSIIRRISQRGWDEQGM